MKSISTDRPSWGGMATPVAGNEGRRRNRLQSPYTQSGSTSAMPENEARTLAGSAASTTSIRSSVAGARLAFVSCRS